MQTQCKNCLMDKSADEITFDKDGICNFCHQAQRELKQLPIKIPKLKGKVLIGLSGGADSSYVLHKAHEMGLDIVAFSVDNGWNDPRADENIMRLVEGMKIPFFRYVIDIPKFKELQMAFIKAGQKNIEIPTDHILLATTYEVASKNGIKWILSGGNVTTESIMPPSWGYNARDLVHIKDVFSKMTGKKLKGLPVCSILKYNYYKWIKRINMFYLLDSLEGGYNRGKAIKELEDKYGYINYGEKHCENKFTWWFQNFYLFEKFGIDKRKAHLSAMINSGEITKSEALQVLGKNPEYPHLGFERQIMSYQKRSYKEFKTDEKTWNLLTILIRVLRKPYRMLTQIGKSITD